VKKALGLRGVLAGLFAVFALCLQAQGLKKFYDPNAKDYMFTREASAGFRLQSNGYTVFLQYGFIKNIYKTRLFQLEYTYHTFFKLKKQDSQPFFKDNGRNFFFGMQNQFHAIRFGYGVVRRIADKADRNGVRLSIAAFGGFSLGLLKPYYLELRYLSQDSTGIYVDIRREKYSEGNRDIFLNRDLIDEAAPIRYGLSEMEPVPGAYGKIALNFDWGRKDVFLKQLEAGVCFDIYYKRLPILLNDKNRMYMLGAYLSFQLGKRW